MTPGIGSVGVTRDYEHHMSAKRCFFQLLQVVKRPYSFSDALKKFKVSCDIYKTRFRCHTKATIKIDFHQSHVTPTRQSEGVALFSIALKDCR